MDWTKILETFCTFLEYPWGTIGLVTIIIWGLRVKLIFFSNRRTVIKHLELKTNLVVRTESTDWKVGASSWPCIEHLESPLLGEKILSNLKILLVMPFFWVVLLVSPLALQISSVYHCDKISHIIRSLKASYLCN